MPLAPDTNCLKWKIAGAAFAGRGRKSGEWCVCVCVCVCGAGLTIFLLGCACIYLLLVSSISSALGVLQRRILPNQINIRLMRVLLSFYYEHSFAVGRSISQLIFTLLCGKLVRLGCD